MRFLFFLGKVELGVGTKWHGERESYRESIHGRCRFFLQLWHSAISIYCNSNQVKLKDLSLSRLSISFSAGLSCKSIFMVWYCNFYCGLFSLNVQSLVSGSGWGLAFNSLTLFEYLTSALSGFAERKVDHHLEKCRPRYTPDIYFPFVFISDGIIEPYSARTRTLGDKRRKTQHGEKYASWGIQPPEAGLM